VRWQMFGAIVGDGNNCNPERRQHSTLGHTVDACHPHVKRLRRHVARPRVSIQPNVKEPLSIANIHLAPKNYPKHSSHHKKQPLHA